MTQRSAVIQNKAGIHVRPSGVIMGEISDFGGTISLESDGVSVELTSIMALLSLGLVQGSEVIIKVEGDNEEAEADRIAALLERNFDFPGREQG
jgi:phosphotransferase system HPr (HPr) family protein